MANVRCPMCSKVNPPEAEVCGYCGARLKPVRPASTPPAKAPKQNSEPDWLRGLRGASSQPEEGASGKSSETASGKLPEKISGKTPDSKPAPSSQPAKSSDADTSDWLSQMRGQSQSDATPFEGAAPDDSQETPDWLKGIGDESADSASTEGFGLETDWMNRLQNPLDTTSKPPAGQPPAPSQPSNGAPFGDYDLAGSNEQPDWMRNLSDETPSGESGLDWALDGETSPFASGETGEGDQEDWMKNLSTWTSDPFTGEGQVQDQGADIFSSNNPAEPAPDQPASSEADDMSWLDSLKFDSSAPAAPNTPEPPQDQGRVSSGMGMTDFLSSLEEPETAKPSTPDFGADFDSWEPPSTEKASSDIFPGWTADEPAASAEPQSGSESDIASWLQSFESEAPSASAETPASAAPAEPEQTESGIPDWLSGAPAEPPRTPKAAPRAETGGLPDWLSGDFNAEQPPQSSETDQPEGSLPGWLSGGEEAAAWSSAESAPEEAAELPEAEPGALPEWLSGEMGVAQTPPAETPEETGAAEETADAGISADAGLSFEGLPNWLSSDEEPETQTPSLSFTSEAAWQPSTSENPEVEPPAEDWLAGFAQAGESSETPAEEAETPAQAFAFDSDETPSWMRDFNTQPAGNEPVVSPLAGDQQGAGTPAGGDASSPFAVDLPDWLGEEASAQPAEAAEHHGEPVSDNLAQADLPDWVMKMRPLESVMSGEALPAESDQRVEKAGPLAGMRGVLPAEELVTHYRKPPIYSAKLRITEKQRGQSTLLDSILAQEAQPLLVPPERSQAPRVILQVIVALVLLLGLLFPLLTNFELMSSQPALAPNELQNMYDLEKSFQSDKPVLLAVDYEPGYSGEMRMAASALIDQLMTNNARIVVVSTVPTGPALGESLLQETAQQFAERNGNSKTYDLNNQVANLGYLPGGTISLIEFASYPRLAAPGAPDSTQVWSRPLLNGVNTISDFSQVIVLTDTAETGRAWVEQVGPALKNVPLLMVASAQASPMLLPYVESGQIKGMVSGLMGGSMYSWRTGQVNNQARRYYAAYQVGMLVALALIVVGASTSSIRSLIKRSPKDEA